jgi:hypothetical protein
MLAHLVSLACATHLGESLAFAAPAIVLPLGLVLYALRERRRERHQPIAD